MACGCKRARHYGIATAGSKARALPALLHQPEAPGPRNGPRDTVNTNVLGHAGETWAVVEAGGYPVRINEELETIAYDPFGGTLKGSFTAHPHLDPDSGEMHAICYQGDIARHHPPRRRRRERQSPPRRADCSAGRPLDP